METADFKKDDTGSIELQFPSSSDDIGNEKSNPVNVEEANGDAVHSNATNNKGNADSCTTELESLPQQRWNHPRVNMWRTFGTFLGFLIMGLNDGAYGVWLLTLSATNGC